MTFCKGEKTWYFAVNVVLRIPMELPPARNAVHDFLRPHAPEELGDAALIFVGRRNRRESVVEV